MFGQEIGFWLNS